MKTNKPFITVLTLAFVLAAVPAFAQRGLGVGGALGGQVKGAAGAVTGAGAQAGGAGVNTNSGAQVNTSAQTGVSTQGAAGQVKAGAGAQSGTAVQAPGVAIATHIDSNPRLAADVQSMLPSGTSISTAAAGFKNEGQFLATLHASQNLGIPFDDLKAKMTGSNDMSLGSAIHASKPGMSKEEANEAAKKAEREAKASAKANASAKTSTSAAAASNTKPTGLKADADDKTNSAVKATTSTGRR
jgi:hypothetical protein